MSRFTQWYVAEQLRRMGWPKSKGIFRKDYVDTRLLDAVVQQAIQVSVGLGAGRPRIGIALLADTFVNNPWTKESTAELLRGLKEGECEIECNPELPPWEALYANHRLAPYGNDIPWQQLGNAVLVSVWVMSSARGVFWGLTHEEVMPGVFGRIKAGYEQTAAEAIPHGLAVTAQFPWNSLEHFYQACEDLVQAFQSDHPPLCEIPNTLRAAPEIVRRLRKP